MAKTSITKKTALIVMLSFIWLMLGQGWAFKGQEDALTIARQLIRDGDYDGAIRLLEGYITKIRLMAEQQKNIAEAYYIISKIYYAISEADQADENLRRVFEIYPNFAIEEPDLSFKGYADEIKRQVLSQRKQNKENPAISIPPSIQVDLEKIKSIVNQYVQAFNSNNLLSFYQEACSPALFQKIKRDVETIMNSYDHFASSASDVTITYWEGNQCQVSFPSASQAYRKQDGKKETIFEGTHIWQMQKQGDNWKIVRIDR